MFVPCDGCVPPPCAQSLLKGPHDPVHSKHGIQDEWINWINKWMSNFPQERAWSSIYWIMISHKSDIVFVASQTILWPAVWLTRWRSCNLPAFNQIICCLIKFADRCMSLRRVCIMKSDRFLAQSWDNIGALWRKITFLWRWRFACVIISSRCWCGLEVLKTLLFCCRDSDVL